MKHTYAKLRELLWVPKSEINVEAEKDKFTFESRFKNKPLVKAYKESKTLFGYPRNASIEVEEIEDQRTGAEQFFNVEFTGELRPLQVPVVDIYQSAISKHSDIILNAETGSGKTIMMLKMWTLLHTTALVIVPKSDLVDQWRERILEFTNCPEDKIGETRQKRCDYEGYWIVIGMLQSIMKDKYPQEFKDYFGLAIFDEIHKLGALHFSTVAGLFPAYYRIGATATLRRADGMMPLVYAHLGEKVITPGASIQPIPTVGVYLYNNSSGKIPSWAKDKIQRRGILISALAKNPHRTMRIAHFANEVMQSGRQTLVLSERTEHLELLHGILLKKYGWKESDVGIYIGKTSNEERKRIASECRGVLATTSMLSEGTDIPTLRGLVFATPLSDVEQALGRISRICENVKDPVVVDIVDSYPETIGWARSRNYIYRKKLKCKVESIK